MDVSVGTTVVDAIVRFTASEATSAAGRAGPPEVSWSVRSTLEPRRRGAGPPPLA